MTASCEQSIAAHLELIEARRVSAALLRELAARPESHRLAAVHLHIERALDAIGHIEPHFLNAEGGRRKAESGNSGFRVPTSHFSR